MRYLPLLLFLLISPMTAQDGYPLPDNLPPITAANAAQVTQLASLGGDLPGQLAWSPDGTTLAAGTSTSVKLYSASGELIREFSGGKDVTFNGNGDVLISTGRLWNVETGEALLDVGRTDLPTRRLSPSKNILVTYEEQAAELIVSLWDISSATQTGHLATLHTGEKRYLEGVAFNPDETTVAVEIYSPENSATLPVSVQLWDIATSTRSATLQLGYDIPNAVMFTPDGRHLVTSSTDGGIYGDPAGDVSVWDAHTGRQINTWDSPFTPRLNADGSLLVFTDLNYGLSVILLNSQEPATLSYGESWLSDPRFTPDGDTLVAFVPDFYDVLLWDLDENSVPAEPRAMFDVGSSYAGMTLSPDGTMLAVTESGGRVQLWDIQTGQLLSSNSVSTGAVIAIFSPDSRLLLTRPYNPGEVRLWSINEGGLQEVMTFPENPTLNSDWSRAAYWEDDSVQIVELATQA